LWEQLSKHCDYAFTDFTRGKIDYFLEMFTKEDVEFFELEDSGLVMIENPTPAGSAFIHYVVWDRAGYTTQQQRNSAKEMFDYLFYNKRVHHVAGLIPSFNQHATRLAMSMGMKFEGEIRDNFLFHGKYYNHAIYGLIESEYRTRRGRL
jgi:RimJ/RimL family protein N-acetyltransferase